MWYFNSCPLCLAINYFEGFFFFGCVAQVDFELIAILLLQLLSVTVLT